MGGLFAALSVRLGLVVRAGVTVDGCARDIEEFCQFGLGVGAGSVDGEQVAAFGGREFGLFSA